jgi:hypothetical protein
LTPIGDGPTALGVFIDEREGQIYFQHGGANVGFRNQFYAHRDDGYGAVVMTNGDRGQELGEEILRAVAEVYGWHAYVPDAIEPAGEAADEAARCAGLYEIRDDVVLVVKQVDGELFASLAPEPPERLVRVGEGEYAVPGRDARVRFEELGDAGFEDAYLERGSAREYGARIDAADAGPSSLLEQDAAAAVERYRALFGEDPSDPAVGDERLDQLARMLLARAGLVENGVALARLQVELRPTSARAMDTLARGLSILGERAEAHACYGRVLKLAEIEADLPEDVRRALVASALAARAELGAG